MRVPNFFRNSDGDVTVAQWPNPAIAAAAALWVASAIVDSHATVLRDVSTGALIAWAADELVRGASPFRRVLGAVVLGWTLYSLTQR